MNDHLIKYDLIILGIRVIARLLKNKLPLVCLYIFSRLVGLIMLRSKRSKQKIKKYFRFFFLSEYV